MKTFFAVPYSVEISLAIQGYAARHSMSLFNRQCTRQEEESRATGGFDGRLDIAVGKQIMFALKKLA